MHKKQFPPEINAYKNALVDAVQNFFSAGLSTQLIKSCLRIDNSFELFSGGLKSQLVGGMQINLNAVLKLGDEEMLLHEKLMKSVNHTGVVVFPEILTCFKSQQDYLLLMENLSGFESLQEMVFNQNTSQTNLSRIIGKTFSLLSHLHSIDAIQGLPSTKSPFYSRLRTKISEAIESDQALQSLWRNPGQILGHPCPPLREIFPLFQNWLDKISNSSSSCLVHGDPHLANIMARRRGRGYSVRLIDPNPKIGISTPFYDYGKLLHWASEVGWAKAEPARCTCTFRSGKTWTLSPELKEYSKSAETRRQHVFDEIHNNLAPFVMTRDAQALLHIATASSHVGLVSLYNTPKQTVVRRYVLAYALKEIGLAYWLMFSE